MLSYKLIIVVKYFADLPDTVGFFLKFENNCKTNAKFKLIIVYCYAKKVFFWLDKSFNTIKSNSVKFHQDKTENTCHNIEISNALKFVKKKILNKCFMPSKSNLILKYFFALKRQSWSHQNLVRITSSFYLRDSFRAST